MSNLPKERFKVIPAVFAMLHDVQKDTFLLIRRFNTGYSDGKWTMPSGHVEAGEPVLAALVREAKEEAGVDVRPEDAKLVVTTSRNADDGHRVDFFFLIEDWQGEVVNCEPHKCDAIEWFSLDNFPVETLTYVRAAVEDMKRGKAYDQFDWNC